MTKPSASSNDPLLWLEDVEAENCLDWARAHNATSQAELEAVPGFARTEARIRAILDAKDKVPIVTKRGDYL